MEALLDLAVKFFSKPRLLCTLPGWSSNPDYPDYWSVSVQTHPFKYIERIGGPNGRGCTLYLQPYTDHSDGPPVNGWLCVDISPYWKYHPVTCVPINNEYLAYLSFAEDDEPPSEWVGEKQRVVHVEGKWYIEPIGSRTKGVRVPF